MSSELKISEGVLDNYTIVTLTGEVDIYTSKNLKDRIYKIIEESTGNIIIECRELNYIDSTGLGIFVGALKESRQKNGVIKIINLKDNIKKLFVITGLDKLFVIE